MLAHSARGQNIILRFFFDKKMTDQSSILDIWIFIMIGASKVAARTPGTKKNSTTKQGGLRVNFILYHIWDLRGDLLWWIRIQSHIIEAGTPPKKECASFKKLGNYTEHPTPGVCGCLEKSIVRLLRTIMIQRAGRNLRLIHQSSLPSLW